MELKDHVFCITAYKDFLQLSSLLVRLSPQCKCYIHVDKRVRIPESFMQQWGSDKNIQIIQTQKIQWGSYRHVLAVLDLLSLIDTEFKYVHIISENTLPACSKDEFLAFFARNPDTNYLEMALSLDQDPEHKRVKYYYFQYLYNARGKYGQYIEKGLCAVQRCLKIRRNLHIEYKGYLYCHLTAEFVAWIMQHVEESKSFLYSIKNVYVPEEYFFQNLIACSPYKETVGNDALIYDIWDEPERGVPAFLEAQDYTKIRNSGKLFARKFSSRSTELDRMLIWE